MKKKLLIYLLLGSACCFKGITFFEYMTTRFSTEDLANRVSLVYTGINWPKAT